MDSQTGKEANLQSASLEAESAAYLERFSRDLHKCQQDLVARLERLTAAFNSLPDLPMIFIMPPPDGSYGWPSPSGWRSWRGGDSFITRY